MGQLSAFGIWEACGAVFAFQARPEPDPWEVNTGRSYYEEQVLSSDKKHERLDILLAEKAPPHESV
jgi:hypothetical protein